MLGGMGALGKISGLCCERGSQITARPARLFWLISDFLRDIMAKLFGCVVLACVFAFGSHLSDATAGDCCTKPVCCVPPPPVEVSWCVEDPCTCCKYTVSACLPACCKCETPCLVGWHPGVFGRKVLTFKFACGECVEVVITKHGKTIVRI